MGRGEFGYSYHLEMIRDRERVSQCCKAIKSVAKRRGTFCELGAGSGIFSIFAARLFDKVIAIEQDPKLIAVINEGIERAGLDNVTVWHDNALNITKETLGQIDVVFCEMMSTWLITEPQVLVMNHVNRCLDGRVISTVPSRVLNLLELANDEFDVQGVELAVPIPQFTGIKPPRVLSCSVLAVSIDLTKVNDVAISSSASVRVLASGRANCVRLTSIVQLATGVSFYSTDTLMPPLVVPLLEPLDVDEGDVVQVSFSYEHRSSLTTASFNAVITPP